MILKNGTVLNDNFIFEKKDLFIENSIISKEATGEVIDCTGKFIIPGLIDIHTHGVAGFDNMDCSFSAINTIAHYMARHGVTTFLPTIITNSIDKMSKAAENIKKAREKGVNGANIGGIYMEGPYFSKKYKGAQNEKYLKNPDTEEFDKINEISGNLIKVISLAPELDGAIDFIDREKDNVKIAIGHTDAGYETAINAIKHGATDITHIFNAMRGFHHREPNVVGAGVDTDVFCECICDGFHLSKTTINMLYKAVGSDRLVLISDSLRATGMADGEYELGGQKFTVVNGQAKLPDGTIAGSTARLMDCVKKAIEFGIKKEDAIKMATLNPAKAAGIDHITGSIKEGKRADLLIVDDKLNIRNVIVNGE